MTLEQEARAIATRVEQDEAFALRLDEDPVTALEEQGYEALTAEVRRRRDHIAELTKRIYADDEFRARVELDPTVLVEEGIPDAALEPVLLAAGAPRELADRAPADVEAHAKDPTTASAELAVALGAFAFAGVPAMPSRQAHPESRRGLVWGSGPRAAGRASRFLRALQLAR